MSSPRSGLVAIGLAFAATVIVAVTVTLDRSEPATGRRVAERLATIAKLDHPASSLPESIGATLLAPQAAVAAATDGLATTAQPSRDLHPTTPGGEEELRDLTARVAAEPGDDLARYRLARALAARAERLRADGRLVEAVTYYRRALDHDPADDQVLLGLAATHLAREQLMEAAGALDRISEQGQELAQYHLLRGEIAYAREEVTEALAALRLARSIAGDERLDGRIARLEREAAAVPDARHLRSRRFQVYFEGGENIAVGRHVLTALEAIYDELRPRFQLADFTVSTILYSDEDYRTVTLAPDWADALYDGKIRIPIAGLTRVDDRFRQVLRHEMAHAFISRKGGPRVPRWLHEGIAQYHEGRRLEDYALSPAQLERLRGLAEPSDPGRFYAQALWRVSGMMDQLGNRKVLALLDTIRRGATFDEALRQVARTNPERLFASLPR